MNRNDWSRLSPLQVGRYAEYFVKMELALYGFEVFTPEVDDRGIDFIVRNSKGQFYEVQVKSIRGYNYVFVPKAKAAISPNRLVAVVVLHQDREPELYLVPMTAWTTPNALLVNRDYEGRQSKPEWGINISRKNQSNLNQYRFETVVVGIC